MVVPNSKVKIAEAKMYLTEHESGRRIASILEDGLQESGTERTEGERTEGKGRGEERSE